MLDDKYDSDGHLRGVAATPVGLLRATLGAALTAGVVLILFWLPAEYGIDPTGLGRTMGLTRMGEIKQGLYAEAAAPRSDPAIIERLDAIEAQLSRLVENGGAPHAMAVPQDGWRDDWRFTLGPDEGIEAKLRMTQGQVASYVWSADGPLYFDMHGDGGGEISYEQAEDAADRRGTLTAAFDGNHGWYWRNRTGAPVTVTLQVGGDYDRLLTP